MTKGEGWAAANYMAPVGNGMGVSAILHTMDGGRSWVELPFVGEQFAGGAELAFSFSDRERGWISWADAEDHELLSETKDAGLTWSHRPSPVPGRFGYLEFFDRHRGWAVASDLSGTSVAFTRDGGARWAVEALPLAGIECARSWNRRDLWVVGWSSGARDKHLRLGIRDGMGTGWRWSDLPAEHEMVSECEVVDRQHAWLVVWLANDKGSYLLRTRDGGGTWDRLPADQGHRRGRYLRALTFVSSKIGLVFADDLSQPASTMLWTLDGGDTWRSQVSNSSASSCQVVSGVVLCADGMDLLRIRLPEGSSGPKRTG